MNMIETFDWSYVFLGTLMTYPIFVCIMLTQGSNRKKLLLTSQKDWLDLSNYPILRIIGLILIEYYSLFFCLGLPYYATRDASTYLMINQAHTGYSLSVISYLILVIYGYIAKGTLLSKSQSFLRKRFDISMIRIYYTVAYWMIFILICHLQNQDIIPWFISTFFIISIWIWRITHNDTH